MKRVLIVSPTFPPMHAPDMQRVRMSLPYYDRHGWEPIVLAVDPASHGGNREDELLQSIPATTTIHRIKAISLSLTKWFGVGNLGWRAWPGLLFAGSRILRRQKVDLVFFSNAQFATFLLGRIWRRLHGVPYVLDFQDPWLTDYYTGTRRKERPGGWKYAFAHAQARHLEAWSLRRVSGLISVSPRYIDDLRRRYPWLSSIPAETIGFGASEHDLELARKLTNHALPADTHVRIVSTGVIGHVMQPALHVFFDALASLPNTCGTAAIRAEFHGTSYASPALPQVLPLAKTMGVEALVEESVPRRGLLETLRRQLDASALLLLGSTDPAYSASKLYPYFLSGRPVLAVVWRNSVLESQLKELSFATVVSFDEKGSTPETRQTIHAFLFAIQSGNTNPMDRSKSDALFRLKYLAPHLTERQCALFEKACKDPTP